MAFWMGTPVSDRPWSGMIEPKTIASSLSDRPITCWHSLETRARHSPTSRRQTHWGP